MKIKIPGYWFAISWVPKRVAAWGYSKHWIDQPYWSFCIYRLNFYWWWRD